MATKLKPGLYPVFCCENKLAEVPANTSIYCPNCGRWQDVEGKHNTKLKGDQPNASSD